MDGFTCSFDDADLCGWTNDRTDNFDFLRSYGAADVQQRTGPESGAGGQGYYMNADTSQSGAGTPGNKARLLSPSITYQGTLLYCHTFWNLFFMAHDLPSLARSINSSIGCILGEKDLYLMS